MIMDDNAINEQMSDEHVSIHSIVTDKNDFHSDNEAPEDEVGQVDKIIKNHVTKEILNPGKGLGKPSKNDFVVINYICYFPTSYPDTIINYYSSTQLKDYIFRIKLPYGIVKALMFMRTGEKARITLQPKFGFRKVKDENFSRYLEEDKLNLKEDKDELYKKMKATPIIYEISLLDYTKIYDISGNRYMMKYILTHGEGLLRPCEGNEIAVSITIFINEEILFQWACPPTEMVSLNENNFNESEILMIKSMKKEEKCRVDVRNSYFNDMIATGCGKVSHYLQAHSGEKITGRVIYDIELLKFKQNLGIVHYKGIQYEKRLITKGIGNVCPWTNAYVMLACHIEVDGDIFYSDIITKYGSFNNFVTYIKDMKKKIKLKKNFEQNLQFMIDEMFKNNNHNENYPIYDTQVLNFPGVVYKEILPTLRILEIIQLIFPIRNTLNDLEINYMKLGEKTLKGYLTNTQKDESQVKLSFCLINFEENVSVFNNRIIKNKCEAILQIKQLANEFYKNSMLKISKKINKRLVDSYIKFVNLGKNIMENKNEIKIDENVFKSSCQYDPVLHPEMKKIMSNLIMILFKLEKLKQAEEYINYFFLIFDQNKLDEKVMYIKYKISVKKQNYEEGRECINSLLSSNSGCGLYQAEYEALMKLIAEKENKTSSMVKRMFKFEK